MSAQKVEHILIQRQHPPAVTAQAQVKLKQEPPIVVPVVAQRIFGLTPMI